ncbi:COQ7-domain-containing protein [Ceraceosorus guamensis]|uniref:5-demethoxyubiquinone hydroxylase, mitochondrial n=1 Tax=Ceraceosorus guamensis TaxID=1522189 RepID=A0A316W3Z1_9BASI|nr:COQ7-domain-containing protein [Ceraceosorus guamensis]PWN44637.1 COQ7-domain-containing protein [Ceraceosorus guamensis]
MIARAKARLLLGARLPVFGRQARTQGKGVTSLASSAYSADDTAPSVEINSASTTAASTPKLGTASTPYLSAHDRLLLSQMLRVDHAGEVAANTIYEAQADVFRRLGDFQTEQLMLEMWVTEKKHLRVVTDILRQHRVTPSKLLPVWSAAGSLLGGVTALLGKEAAMACTEAVETVIGEHYDDQLDHLSSLVDQNDAGSRDTGFPHEGVDPSLPLLSSVIKEFRDDELEHLDTAVEHDAQQAPAHALLSAVVGWGCRAAIQVAGRY